MHSTVLIRGQPVAIRYPWLVETFINPNSGYSQILKHRSKIVQSPRIIIHIDPNNLNQIAFGNDEVQSVELLMLLLGSQSRHPKTLNLKREVLRYLRLHPDFEGMLRSELVE